MLDYLCPHCEKRIGVPDLESGKSVRCPHCENSFVVLEHDAAKSRPSENSTDYSAQQSSEKYSTLLNNSSFGEEDSNSSPPLHHSIASLWGIIVDAFSIIKRNPGSCLMVPSLALVLNVVFFSLCNVTFCDYLGIPEAVALNLNIMVILVGQSINILLLLGIIRIYLMLARDDEASLDLLFSCTVADFFRMMGVALAIVAAQIVPIIIMVLGARGIAMSIGSEPNGAASEMYPFLIGSWIMLGAGIVLSLYCSARCILIPFFTADLYLGPLESVRQSSRFLKGNLFSGLGLIIITFGTFFLCSAGLVYVVIVAESCANPLNYRLPYVILFFLSYDIILPPVVMINTLFYMQVTGQKYEE